jgi:hypothetical protein
MGLAALLMAATLIATPRAGWSVTGHDYMPDPPPGGSEGEPDIPPTMPRQQGFYGSMGKQWAIIVVRGTFGQVGDIFAILLENTSRRGVDWRSTTQSRGARGR